MGDEKFKVHKAILGARSVVLKEKIKDLRADSGVSHLELDDVDANDFDYFLRYIYRDNVTDLHPNAANLIVIAEQVSLT